MKLHSISLDVEYYRKGRFYSFEYDMIDNKFKTKKSAKSFLKSFVSFCDNFKAFCDSVIYPELIKQAASLFGYIPPFFNGYNRLITRPALDYYRACLNVHSLLKYLRKCTSVLIDEAKKRKKSPLPYDSLLFVIQTFSESFNDLIHEERSRKYVGFDHHTGRFTYSKT